MRNSQDVLRLVHEALASPPPQLAGSTWLDGLPTRPGWYWVYAGKGVVGPYEVFFHEHFGLCTLEEPQTERSTRPEVVRRQYIPVSMHTNRKWAGPFGKPEI